ncbi:tRNA lysidine(34) synthetase [Hydrogenophaga soli]
MTEPLVLAARQWVVLQSAPPSALHPLVVAFSGGADSTALLHVAQRCWPGAVHAVHINHGLQAAAADFERHCQQVCSAWGLPLRVVRPCVRVSPGDSVEAVAREHRYTALTEAARDLNASGVWMAHHADDQLETLLLALSRGAGVPGLAAMPSSWVLDGVRFGRPWLALPGAALKSHVEAHGLPHIVDPTNADLRFTRNRIRLQVLPVLREVFPSMAQTVSRTARHCAQASRLLDALAADDLLAAGEPPRLRALQALPSDRLANALRLWLRRCSAKGPSAAQLDQLMKQVLAATTRGHRLELRVAQGRVCRVGDGLKYVPDATGVGGQKKTSPD